ncbi:MAG: flagellar biosynthetic protein FliQ [Proteobacteria bacterium]|nr:flagellar biosynthetic protein FliQ [Pseudomonadota bacterium]
MDTVAIMDIGREAIWVMIKVSLPLMLVAMVIGLAISLFQALTQIQESTLSFVPKIVAVFLSMILFMPFMFSVLKTFTEGLAQHIVGIE